VFFTAGNSGDAGYHIAGVVRDGAFHGVGVSFGNGADRWPHDTIVGHRIGAPDAVPCGIAARQAALDAVRMADSIQNASQESQIGDNALPHAIPQRYEPYDPTGHDVPPTESMLGPVRLSTTAATFASLKSTMRLKPDGVVPPDISRYLLSQAHFYRVLNATAFYEQNGPGLCGQPVRWLALQVIDRTTIRLSLWTIADWRNADQVRGGPCITQFYRQPDHAP
jgi:hypothetical protein